MSEEQEQSQDKQSALKLKLKKMGVMGDKGDSSTENSNSFWRNKLPVFIVLLLAIAFWWWYNASQQAGKNSVAGHTPTTTMPGGYSPQGYGPPPGYGRSTMPPEAMGKSDRSTQAPGKRAYGDGSQQRPGWYGPDNRYDDRFGPPPGWGPGYDVPPPPPPVYYGQPYYGPPPVYYPHPYNDYYGPPPPGVWW